MEREEIQISLTEGFNKMNESPNLQIDKQTNDLQLFILHAKITQLRKKSKINKQIALGKVDIK